MVAVNTKTQAGIQQAVNRISDLIQMLNDITVQDVVMTVDPDSPAIPHGAVVNLNGDSIVGMFLLRTAVAGVNVGPERTAGQSIQVRGGTPAEALFGADPGVSAGTLFYFDTAAVGLFTTTQRAPGDPAAGIIYDATGFDIETGGIVKVLLDGNHPIPVA